MNWVARVMLNVWVCVCFCEWMLGAHLLTHVGGRHNETMSIPNRNKMVVYSCPWRSRLYCSSLIWKIIYLFCYPDSPRSLSTRASSRGRWKNRLKKKNFLTANEAFRVLFPEHEEETLNGYRLEIPSSTLNMLRSGTPHEKRMDGRVRQSCSTMKQISYPMSINFPKWVWARFNWFYIITTVCKSHRLVVPRGVGAWWWWVDCFECKPTFEMSFLGSAEIFSCSFRTPGGNTIHIHIKTQPGKRHVAHSVVSITLFPSFSQNSLLLAPREPR